MSNYFTCKVVHSRPRDNTVVHFPEVADAFNEIIDKKHQYQTHAWCNSSLWVDGELLASKASDREEVVLY